MTIDEKSLTPFVAGRQSPSFLRPSVGFHKLLRARGDDVIRCCPTALSRHRLPAFSTSVSERSKDRHSGCGITPWRGFSSTEIKKLSFQRGKVSKMGSMWRRGSVLEGRVQVKSRVWWAHALPFEVRGARGGGFSSRLVYLLAHGPRRDWSAWHPGPTAISRVRLRLDCKSGGSRLWGHGNPSTLPSWTHEDISVHARERDRSLEERRLQRLTAAVMGLHSCQVCLITRRQIWLFQRPSYLINSLPSGAWWRAALKNGVVMMIRGEAADLSQYVCIYLFIYQSAVLKYLKVKFNWWYDFAMGDYTLWLAYM